MRERWTPSENSVIAEADIPVRCGWVGRGAEGRTGPQLNRPVYLSWISGCERSRVDTSASLLRLSIGATVVFRLWRAVSGIAAGTSVLWAESISWTRPAGGRFFQRREFTAPTLASHRTIITRARHSTRARARGRTRAVAVVKLEVIAS